MLSKEKLRKKFIFLRKKKYFFVKKDFFKPLLRILKIALIWLFWISSLCMGSIGIPAGVFFIAIIVCKLFFGDSNAKSISFTIEPFWNGLKVKISERLVSNLVSSLPCVYCLSTTLIVEWSFLLVATVKSNKP